MLIVMYINNPGPRYLVGAFKTIKMKLKGFKKLSLQIGVLSISMIALSFLTDTQFWLDHFNYMCDASITHEHFGASSLKHNFPRYHWNYRGWVYFSTGLVYFFISVVKIFSSHKKDDFKN